MSVFPSFVERSKTFSEPPRYRRLFHPRLRRKVQQCLVGIERVDGGKEASLLLGQQVALHVAAAAPLYLNVASVPVEATERESAVLREQALASGKPENIVDKMIQGRIKKFYSEHCLVDQEFVVDDSKRSVKKVVSSEGGEKASLIGFAWRKTGGTASGEKSGF